MTARVLEASTGRGVHQHGDETPTELEVGSISHSKSFVWMSSAKIRTYSSVPAAHRTPQRQMPMASPWTGRTRADWPHSHG